MCGWDPWCYPCLQAMILGIFSLVVTIVGAVFWSSDDFTDQNIGSLVSIPLTMSQENNDTYIITNQTNQSLYYSNNFALDLAKINLIQSDSSYSFRIIHNMFKYNINLSIVDNNIVRHSYTSKESYTSVDYHKFNELGFDLSETQTSNDCYKVLCPYSSIITNITGIGDDCKTEEAPLFITGDFVYIDIGINIQMDAINDFVNFHNSSFTISNNTDVPQAYFATSLVLKPLAEKGKTIFIVGIVVFSVMTIEFFITCCKIISTIRL